jgi:steroid 5-alpha reductase family enzyme
MLIQPLVLAAVGLFLYMCFAFFVSVVRKDNGTADIAYGWGFVLVAIVTYILGTQSFHAALVSVFATIWAARLSIRIYLRNRGKPEDFRYKKWREEWGKSFLVRSFFQVYMLQGVIIFFVVLPVSLVNLYGGPVALGSGPDLVAALGVLLWLVGFFFESVGDWQLGKFMHDLTNKGKIMDQGLWHYTRHPNYFGESTMWWGIALIAFGTLLAVGAIVPAVLSFIGPILITFFLLKVSGVPMLEKHFEGNPSWEAYKAKTSVFIPLPPHKK